MPAPFSPLPFLSVAGMLELVQVTVVPEVIAAGTDLPPAPEIDPPAPMVQVLVAGSDDVALRPIVMALPAKSSRHSDGIAHFADPPLSISDIVSPAGHGGMQPMFGDCPGQLVTYSRVRYFGVTSCARGTAQDPRVILKTSRSLSHRAVTERPPVVRR